MVLHSIGVHVKNYRKMGLAFDQIFHPVMLKSHLYWSFHPMCRSSDHDQRFWVAKGDSSLSSPWKNWLVLLLGSNFGCSLDYS